MALMKTKRNGEDPTNKSGVIVKQKREAYKPNVENQRKTAEYESALSKNKAIEDKYKSEVESYGKQMKAYSEQPKGRKDMTTLFQGGGRYLDPTELSDWNKQRSSDRAGLQSKKVFVSKGYGKESSDKGKFSSEKGGTYSGYLGASHEFFEEPKAPVKREITSVERPKLEIERLPLNKVISITTAGSRKLAVSDDKEKWNAPSKPLVGIEEKFSTRGGKMKKTNALSKAVENVKRNVQYKQELKKGKAYFGGFEGQSAGDISDRKKELKQDVQDIKNTRGVAGPTSMTESEVRQAKRSMIKDVKSEQRQAKLAGKYVKEVGREYTGVKAGEKTENTKFGSKVRFATPEAMAGYRSSMDNAANKNTIDSKMKAEKKK
jgi:hypothetical protein